MGGGGVESCEELIICCFPEYCGSQNIILTHIDFPEPSSICCNRRTRRIQHMSEIGLDILSSNMHRCFYLECYQNHSVLCVRYFSTLFVCQILFHTCSVFMCQKFTNTFLDAIASPARIAAFYELCKLVKCQMLEHNFCVSDPRPHFFVSDPRPHFFVSDPRPHFLCQMARAVLNVGRMPCV